MKKNPSSTEKTETPEGDPKRGDQILRRMLKSKPKTHDQMVDERRRGQRKPKKAGKGAR